MELKIKDCTEQYWLQILNIRNSDKIFFIDQDEISESNHIEYMKKNSHNYQVCLADDNFAGFVGCVNNDIRIGVKEEYRNKGIGKYMLDYFVNKNNITTAKIKLNNEASIRLFESCGFKKQLYILKK